MRIVLLALVLLAGCASMPPQRIEAECKTLAAEVRVSYAIGLEDD
jgi:outer membrane murein-binding lipoprotein Lpp